MIMEYDEAAIMKLVDEQIENTNKTREIITPVFDKMVNLSWSSDFYAKESGFVLSYDDPDKPFYGSYFMGDYNHEEDYIDIDINSETGFDHFFEIFPNAPKIDFEHINQIINEFRLMYAFILGKDIVYSVNSLEDLKDHFYWSGNQYRFTARLFEEDIYTQKHFTIKIFYGICTKTCDMVQSVRYEFQHPDIGFKCEQWDSIDEIKTEFFKYVAKMLNKPVSEITLMDYKLLPMLNV